MAVNGSAFDQYVSGIVSSVNPKGVKLEGQDGWCNFSRFAEDIVPPMRGEHVTLTLDRSGFVRSIETGPDAPMPSAAPQSAPSASSPFDSQARSGQARERTITRLAVLKAAAEFGAARPNLKSGEILAIAASWERWVNRDQETTHSTSSGQAPDLTDAF